MWSATCDTLHAHTQVLGKLAAALAPPEPQLQHAALRLSVRGWETLPLPAPDGSGALVVSLDLRSHEAVIEHTDGRVRRVPLAPDRPVAEVTREVLAAADSLVGRVRIDLRPQEVPWTAPLDEDYDHATYDPAHAAAYFAVATRAALVLAALRAPYRGRSSPVNAWWGTFDLAVSLFSGRSVDPPSDGFITRNAANAQQIESAGGRATDATHGPRSSPLPSLHRRGSRLRPWHRRPPVGRRRSVSTCSTGTTSACSRPPRRRARVRPLGDPARLHGVRLGPSPRRQRRGRSPAGGLTGLLAGRQPVVSSSRRSRLASSTPASPGPWGGGGISR